MAIPMSAALLGSCTDAPTGAMLVCEEKLFTVVVPSGLTSAVKAKPSVVALVSGCQVTVNTGSISGTAGSLDHR